MTESSAMVLIECEDDIVKLYVQFRVIGSYEPAHWDYWGGQPEQHPEIEIIGVERENGEEVPFPWVFGDAVWDPPWKLDIRETEEFCYHEFCDQEADSDFYRY